MFFRAKAKRATQAYLASGCAFAAVWYQEANKRPRKTSLKEWALVIPLWVTTWPITLLEKLGCLDGNSRPG